MTQVTPAAPLLKIGLWGTRGSGKTTFMLMLMRMLNSQYPNWYAEPADRASQEWLLAAREQMDVRHEFVEKTKRSGIYTFNLSERINSKLKLAFQLKLYDEPGEVFEVRPKPPTDGRLSETTPDSASAPLVAQRSGADAEATKTPLEAFQTLMDCHAILVMLDPGWQKNNSQGSRPYSNMIADLLDDINGHLREQEPDKTPDQRRKPVIALCLSKLEGGKLQSAIGGVEKEMWLAKDKQPVPAFEASIFKNQPNRCFLGHTLPIAASTATSTYAPCEDDCLVFHLLSKSFFAESVQRFVGLGWEIACFPLSAIGMLPTSDGTRHGHIKRIIPTGDWQRDHTPHPPHYESPEIDRLHTPQKPEMLNIKPSANTSLEQVFYRRRLIETDQPFAPYQLFEPILWAYERVKPR